VNFSITTWSGSAHEMGLSLPEAAPIGRMTMPMWSKRTANLCGKSSGTNDRFPEAVAWLNALYGLLASFCEPLSPHEEGNCQRKAEWTGYKTQVIARTPFQRLIETGSSGT
jgi:hypothetical protein